MAIVAHCQVFAHMAFPFSRVMDTIRMKHPRGRWVLGIGVLATCAFDCEGTPGGNTSDVRGKLLALSQEFLLEIQGLH